MAVTKSDPAQRRERLKARDVLRRMRFKPVTWWRGGIHVEEMYRVSPMFQVTHIETDRSIRTTADGIGAAIAKLRRMAAERPRLVGRAPAA